MKYYIRRFSPFKTALHVSAFYFVMTFILMVILAIFELLSIGRPVANYGDDLLGRKGFDFIGVITTPIESTILGFVSIFIACFIYNKIAGKLGGIELELSEAMPSSQKIERTEKPSD